MGKRRLDKKTYTQIRVLFLKRGKWLLKKCWLSLAILMIIMAILFSLFRALTPWAKQYKGEVERHLTTLIGQPVAIKSMETSWYWFQPVLKMNQVTLLDSQDHVLKMAKLMVGINLLSSLWHWDIQPGILYVDDVHLVLRQIDHHWQIDGLSQDKQVKSIELGAYLPVLSWLLSQQKIIIKDVSALVHLNNGTLLPLSKVNLTAVNHNGHYRLKGEAKLAQTMATEVLVLADMNLNPYALNKVSGHAYLSVRKFIPTQWQTFFPQSAYRVDGGKGDFEVWVDLKKGHLSGLQSRLDFHRIGWSIYGERQNQFIQSLRANLAWTPIADGWQLSADQIKLRAGGTRWPENALQIRHQQAQNSYQLFVKSLLIDPILMIDVDWPDVMQPVLSVHPHGQLQDTQVDINNGHVDYVLSRFDGLGWRQHKDIPAVSNISGVLSWQPSEGRLELDGENTTLYSPGLPPITFDQANAAVEWKEISDGLRVSMERLILSHPDLLFSARGALDEALSPTARNLRLTAEFSAKHATRWLRYLPAKYVKPKLDDWLKHDIKRIETASGQLTISGTLADFPFETQPGEFSINSRVSGMDLSFNKEWPLITDMDADIHVNKRNMNVDVYHASLLNIETTQANLRMDDMGLGKETLLIHGKSDVQVNQLKDYIFASPLRSNFSKLKQLEVKGPVGMDLSLEVPLYPENDDILARGALVLNNNKAIFHHALTDVKFNNVSGTLAFDEHGVMDSELTAKLFGDPVGMHIQSKRGAKSYTEISMEGDTTIDVLRKELGLPILAFMAGELKITSQLALTDNPKDMDSIQMNTSLEGVSIDLPAPFGKSSKEKAPLSLKAEFKSDKAVKLWFNYDHRLSSDLWFISRKDVFGLDRGAVRLGPGEAAAQDKPGLQMVGTLPHLDVKEWLDVWSSFPKNMTQPKLLEQVQHVDVTLGDVVLWDKNYRKVAIKADKLNTDTWAVKLDQQDIAADVRYQYKSNTLSGRIMRLYLNKTDFSSQHGEKQFPHLKPMDIPNLDLTIDALKFGKVDVGSVALKSTSTEANWHLEDCKINAPGYLLTLKGDWTVQAGVNNTKLQADMQINNLAQGLKNWQITPVVEAHKGTIQFNGGWPGAINDYSLAKIDGNVYMMIQDGRITHLSKETEEKLGLGKLLSILSLQTIPRRLKLDFSDLSNPGYSFDTLKGTFTLKHGVMSTTDSYIDGPVAYASMKGDLDLVKQLYDVDLHISPHITASLPVVATIAGGPIAGMAAWVASKIINQGMQQVTGYTYKVSGPWLNPVVQQVNIYRKRAS